MELTKMQNLMAAEAYRLFTEEREPLSSIAKLLAPAGEVRSRLWAKKLIQIHRATLPVDASETLLSDVLNEEKK